MTEKLEITEKRFDEINEKLTDINVINDQEQYKSLMKELKNLTPIIEKYRMYKTARSDFEEAEQMLSDGGLDKDFKEIVQEQYENNKKLMDEYTDELKILLLPKDPDDDRNVIIEIRGGAGGEEAALFANSMFRMYSMYAQTKGWKTEVISSNPTELGGYKEISISVDVELAVDVQILKLYRKLRDKNIVYDSKYRISSFSSLLSRFSVSFIFLCLPTVIA